MLLHDVPWSTYVGLRDSAANENLRMTYLEGSLEIMSTSPLHEVTTARIARLVELFCLEREIPLYSYGHMTVRDEAKARGLEPDVWYCRGQDQELPQIAIEIVVTTPLIDRLDVYHGLGIRELWLWKRDAITILSLRGDQYSTIETSEIIPEIYFTRIAHHLRAPDPHVALKAFRDEIRRIS